MQIWLQSSKKCLRAEFIVIALFIALFGFSAPSVASVSPEVLKKEIQGLKASSFEKLLGQWERRYGAEAVLPLLELAATRTMEDHSRYIALMSAAKLGGEAFAPSLLPFLKDQSWMIRSGALRSLGALKNPKTSQAVLPLLHDRALVVRVEAVAAIERLRPSGAVDALIATLKDKANYHAGKALWVPQKAIAALVSMKARAAIPHIEPLLDRPSDKDLVKQVRSAIKALSD